MFFLKIADGGRTRRGQPRYNTDLLFLFGDPIDFHSPHSEILFYAYLSRQWEMLAHYV